MTRTLIVIGILFIAASAFAQRPSPAEAVAVLHASTMRSDQTHRMILPRRSGPDVIVVGTSLTPWDWPTNATDPIAPLSTWRPSYLTPWGLSEFAYIGGFDRGFSRPDRVRRPSPDRQRSDVRTSRR